LRQFKIESLRKIIKSAVDTKYKISLSKGMQLVIEAFIILLFMVSIIIKANLVSFIFLIFIFKFTLNRSKTDLIVRANTYTSIVFMVTYFFYLINLTSKTSR
jgi:hypothetical protein